MNRKVSDEFNGAALDGRKWHVQGTGGQYNNNFIGRAPSQFTPNNVSVEDGFLKIITRWEPGFDFSDQPGQGGLAYENITTAAVITKAEIRYGYLEIRCKAADGPISSAFWAIGGKGEIDVFEHWGHNPKNPESARRYHTSFHDWRDPESPTWSKRVWTNDHLLDFGVGDGFHVYALEWDPAYLRIFVDGQLIRHVTREEIGDAWVADGAQKIWMDSEVFPWEVNPATLMREDYPGDGLEYVVDYVRVWQRAGGAAAPGPVFGDNLMVDPELDAKESGWRHNGDAGYTGDAGLGGGPAAWLQGKGAFEQAVEVKPDTTYVLSAWVAVPGTNGEDIWQNAWLGVKGYGGEDITKKFFRSEYYRGSLQFTTGPQVESVSVFFTNEATGHEAYADRFELYEAPVAVPRSGSDAE